MTDPPNTSDTSEDTEPSTDGGLDGTPFLPAAPTMSPLPAPEPPPEGGSDEAPILPQATPVVAPAPEPVEFDAKAMVASQKRFEWKPVYGEIPRGTPESLETAEQLRELARRKRRRNRLIGWFIALALAAAIGIAGWFAYRAYQDDQDQRAADRAARAATEATEAPGVLGEQDQVVELLDDLNSGGATSSAGGLLGAVDDARTVVAGVDGGAQAVDALTIDDVLPQPIVRLGRRLDDAEGHTRYVVDGRLFASDSPDEYARFLALAEALPQRDADAAELGLIPALQPAEIGVAIQAADDRPIRAVIVSPDLDLYVVYP